jgi:biotin synthase
MPRGLRLLPAGGALPHWVANEPMLAVDAVLDAARAAKAAGATRFCMGAAWRGPKDRELAPVSTWCAASRTSGWRPAARSAC